MLRSSKRDVVIGWAGMLPVRHSSRAQRLASPGTSIRLQGRAVGIQPLEAASWPDGSIPAHADHEIALNSRSIFLAAESRWARQSLSPSLAHVLQWRQLRSTSVLIRPREPNGSRCRERLADEEDLRVITTLKFARNGQRGDGTWAVSARRKNGSHEMLLGLPGDVHSTADTGQRYK